ncbi:MAG: site-specific integrase, partial [Bacteroidales bacterium]|nr:site-specific integrase [Bacteroidales bacterium]
MKITIRTRTLKAGSRSIYLDFYEKGSRWEEYLNLFLVPDDAPNAKRLNEAAMAKANTIKSKRMLGIEDDEEETDDGLAKLPKRILADWLDEYAEAVRRNPAFASSTYLNIRTTVNIIKAYLKFRRRPRFLMSKIDKGFVIGFLDFMKNVYHNTKSPENPKKLSPHTLFLHQSTFKRMLNDAVKEGLINGNPFYALSKLERIAQQKPERDYLSKDELLAFAEAPTTNEMTKRSFMFCCFTGLRYSDVCALTWRNIKAVDSGLVVSIPAMKKTGKQIIIPLNQSALKWLPERNGCHPGQKVFKMTTLGCCDRCLKKMAAAAGIEKAISYHTSRHTFATLSLAAGGDLYTVSKLLGHSDISTTQIYADVVMETKIDAVSR